MAQWQAGAGFGWVRWGARCGLCSSHLHVGEVQLVGDHGQHGGQRETRGRLVDVADGQQRQGPELDPLHPLRILHDSVPKPRRRRCCRGLLFAIAVRLVASRQLCLRLRDRRCVSVIAQGLLQRGKVLLCLGDKQRGIVVRRAAWRAATCRNVLGRREDNCWSENRSRCARCHEHRPWQS